MLLQICSEESLLINIRSKTRKSRPEGVCVFVSVCVCASKCVCAGIDCTLSHSHACECVCVLV